MGLEKLVVFAQKQKFILLLDTTAALMTFLFTQAANSYR